MWVLAHCMMLDGQCKVLWVKFFVVILFVLCMATVHFDDGDDDDDDPLKCLWKKDRFWAYPQHIGR